MMKNAIRILSASLLALAGSLLTTAQTYTLQFSAEFDSNAITMDSIYIYNVTRDCADVIHAPQTSFSITSTLNIETQESSNPTIAIRHISPNPFSESTEIGISIPGKQKVTMLLHDLSGRELARFEGPLSPGNHSFTCSGGQSNVLILSVISETHVQSLKLLRLGPGNADPCQITHIGAQPAVNLKTNPKLNFQWVPGDQLLFICYATIGAGQVGTATITDTPTGNAAYDFVIDYGSPCNGTPYVVDADGNIYPTVQIGSQCWMRENLRTSTYKNGTSIPLVVDGSTWENLTSGAYCHVNHNPALDIELGKLYNYYTVATGNLCPAGYHVPDTGDYKALFAYLMNNGYHCGINTTYIAKALASRELWEYAAPVCMVGNDPASNNASGFSGVPGGYRHATDNTFYNTYQRAYTWTSSLHSNGVSAYYFFNSYADRTVTLDYFSGPKQGHTVRCIKD
jgi:uncharacterized protein (TIGR02145 family)